MTAATLRRRMACRRSGMAVVGVWINGLPGLGKPADHKTVGVGDELLHQLVVDGVSAFHCDPVSFVHVVAAW